VSHLAGKQTYRRKEAETDTDRHSKTETEIKTLTSADDAEKQDASNSEIAGKYTMRQDSKSSYRQCQRYTKQLHTHTHTYTQCQQCCQPLYHETRQYMVYHLTQASQYTG